MGTLYIVATPIGNLKDITLRAIDILQNVDVIMCEDTRKTGMLLKSLQATKKPQLLSYYEQNEWKRIPEVINLLKNGCNVALVSDAGTPTISDPGFKLVRECVSLGLKVESIPGPSAVISALVSSGLPTDKFLFVGFLPHKEGHKKKLLKDILSVLSIIKSTVILYEAPHKLVQTLKDMLDAFGDIEIVVSRELTKVHEEIRREKITSAINHFEMISPKGEIVVLFNLGKN